MRFEEFYHLDVRQRRVLMSESNTHGCVAVDVLHRTMSGVVGGKEVPSIKERLSLLHAGQLLRRQAK